MAGEFVQVDSSRATVALGKFRLSLEQNAELMQEIGASQLLSVRRTFREQGSPAGSWMPLAPSTIRRNPKLYGAGHKLLILSGRLLNSISVKQERPGEVIIGTNLVYAAVHQFGSRDRSFGAGPRTAAEEAATVNMPARSYYRMSAELGTGHLAHAGKRRIQGPRNATRVNARAHTRHQNIPPRPYLVFRPEDPQRIAGIVQRYVAAAAQKAGLGGAQ
jgi:phage virion morphogenesis protein